MNSIKELRRICQDPKDCHNPKSLIEERVPRILSIYITKLLIYTPVKADHVTMLMVFWGFISAFLFSIGTYWYMLVGAIWLEFILVLDCIDGEIARYRKISSLKGVFLDSIAHLTHTAVPFIGLTIGLYKFNPSAYTVLLGLSAGVFSVLCLTVQSVKHYVIVKELVKYAPKNRLKKVIPKKVDKRITKETIKIRNLKSVGRTINLLYHGFNIIHIILFAVIFNKPYWVLIFYGLTFPLMWLAKLVHEYKVGYEPYEYLLNPYKKD